MSQVPSISLVIPLYNEEKVFSDLITRLNQLIQQFPDSIEVVLVDDGSKDNTAELMQALSLSNPHYTSLFLSRNFGHQVALSAGLAHCRGTKAIMVLDGDLQDPPELLDSFYSKLNEGYDVVYAVRKKRKEGIIKKMCYHLYYRLLGNISYINLPVDSGDFCLMSRRVVDVINKMPEESRYIRGMRSWVGFKQIGIEYDRDERLAGKTKYNLSMLFKLAYNGIFNFSEIPIKFISRLGILSIIVSMGYLAMVLFKKFFSDQVPTGFTALIVAIVLFSGVQLISIGIIGEYVLRIFFQVKQRPIFLLKSKIEDGNEQTSSPVAQTNSNV